LLFVLIYDCRDIRDGDIFDEFVIDERDRGATATSEALNKIDAEISIRGCGWSLTKSMTMAMRVNPHRLAKFFTNFVAACHRTSERAADSNDVFAGAFATEPRVECHNLEDIHGRELKLGGDPFHTAVIDKTKVVLPKVKKGGEALRFETG